jgi:plastocyanin
MKRLLALLLVIVAAVAAAFAVPAFARTKTVKIGDNYFVRPANNATVTVSRGTRVVWKWRGSAPHNVTVTRGPKRFHSSTKSRGTFVAIPHTRGTYRIVCTIHAGMKMTLKVR